LFRPGDEPALAQVCIRTADAGADATGLLSDDAIWPAIFVLPYAARHPEFAFVALDDAGDVAGYIVAAPDTHAFEAWFRDEWWPRFADRYPRPADADGLEARILGYAYGRAPGVVRYSAEYPAHLHIDLLPDLQGRGVGRRLVDTLIAALRAAGVPGLHLVAGSDNAGALAFYPRLGFEALPSDAGSQAFGMRLRPGA
jgi:ribosomal protein S18 acetylase RimI-like enzyme